MLMMNLFNTSLFLYEIEEGKYKHPYKINEVPVQSGLFNLLIMSSSPVNAVKHIEPYNYIDDHTAEYVKAVESGNKEEETCKIRRSVLILHQVSAKKSSAFCNGRSGVSTVDKV